MTPGARRGNTLSSSLGLGERLFASSDERRSPGAAGSPSTSPRPVRASALAFEVALIGTPELALVIHTARGANLPAPATLLAMRAVATLLGDTAIVSSAHPSPLSASRGFFGSRPFSRVNALLEEQGAAPVDWRLPA